jgi:carotenoid cleavage dioxygenase-like enzyme
VRSIATDLIRNLRLAIRIITGFLGDGMIHAFHVEDGRVSYRNRWAQTPKFLAERAAHRALYGSWGNPMTTDPSVRGKD